MYSWTNEWYHNDKGKILGSISTFQDGRVKALFDNVFIGWFINIESAKKAVEDAHTHLIKIENKIN